MPRTEVPELHETVEIPDEAANETTFYATDEAHSLADEPIHTQAELDAEALSFPAYAASDANAVQGMLEHSLRNELKASKAYNKWRTEQGKKGDDLLRACTEHRQRTSRLYRILTDGVDGESS